MSRIRPYLRRLLGAALPMLAGVAIVSLVEAAQEQSRQTRQPVQSIRGVVDDVDQEARALMVRPSDGPSRRIRYTDATKVAGARVSTEGLAVTSGREVIVQFTVERSTRVATSVELLPRR